MGWGAYILGGALRGAGEGMLAQLEHDRAAQRELEEARLRRDRILAALRNEARPEDGAAGGAGASPDVPATVRTNRLAVILSNPTAQQKEDIDAALPEGVQLRRRQDGDYSAPRKYEGVVHGVLNAGEQPDATDDRTDGIVVNRDAVRTALESPASQSADLSFDGLLERNVADAGARHLGKQLLADAKGDPDRANALLAGTFGPNMSEAAKSGSDAEFDAEFSGGDESGNRLKAVYGPVGDSWTDDLRSFGRYVIDGETGADGVIPFRWQENEAVMRRVNAARAEFEKELLRSGLAPVDIGVGAYNIGTGNGTTRDYLVVGGAGAGPVLSKTGAVVLPLVTRGGRIAAESGSINLMARSDTFLVNAGRRADIDPGGMLDVVAHGDANMIEIAGRLVDHRVAARIIQGDAQFVGQDIRLLSCNTGSCPTGFAQNLSNMLGVKVHAPDDLLWAFPDGRMTVGPTPVSNTGRFVTFVPGGK